MRPKISLPLLMILLLQSIVFHAQVITSVNPGEHPAGAIKYGGTHLTLHTTQDAIRSIGHTIGLPILNQPLESSTAGTIRFFTNAFGYHNGQSWIRIDLVNAPAHLTMPATPHAGSIYFVNGRHFGFNGTAWRYLDSIPLQPFSPAIVKGLTCWFDAKDPASIETTPEKAVILWKDKISNRHAYQYFASCRPIYNQDANGPFVDFGPFVNSSTLSGKFMYLNSGGPQQTVIAVLSSPNGGGSIWGSKSSFYQRGGSGGTSPFDPLFHASAGVFNDGAVGDDAVPDLLGCFLNGQSVNPLSTGLSGSTDLLVAITRKSNQRFDLLGSNGLYQFGGQQLREILCFNAELDEVTRQKIEGYLAWKWNIVAQLPANHPYRSSPPAIESNFSRPYHDLKRHKNGLFVHFGGRHYHIDPNLNTTQTNQQFTEQMDIDAFVNQVVATKVDYVLMTAWHGNFDLYYPSPTNLRWRDAGRAITATNLDMLGKMARSLKTKGVDVYFYIHPTAGKFIGHGSNRSRIGIDDPTNGYATYNRFMNDLMAEQSEKFGNLIDGYFFDEGFTDVRTSHFLNMHNLRRTIKKNQPTLQIMQNGGIPYLTTDLDATELPPGTYPDKAIPLSNKIPMPYLPGSLWAPSVALASSFVRYNPRSMLHFVVLQAAGNPQGGGVLWAASPYLGPGAPFENGVINSLIGLNQLIEPRYEAINNTYPSTSFPISNGTTIGLTDWGVATKSADNKYEYLHILYPPAGNRLQIGIPEDGKVFSEAVLIPGNTPVTLLKTTTGYQLTLPTAWDADDTVIKLTVSQTLSEPIPTPIDFPTQIPDFTPTAMYSVRKLNPAYNGPCMRVRRSSDNAMMDIGFTANNELDTLTLKNFVGSANGQVHRWYDQSGANLLASQESQNDQPYIISNGQLEKIAGKPAIRFGATQATRLIMNRGGLNINMLAVVGQMSSPSTIPGLIGAQNQDAGVRFFEGSTAFAGGFQSSDAGIGGLILNGQINTAVQGQNVGSNRPFQVMALRGDHTTTFPNGVGIGGYFWSGQRGWIGKMSEVFLDDAKSLPPLLKLSLNQRAYFGF